MSFNFVAQVQLQAAGVQQVAQQIGSALRGVTSGVNVQVNPASMRGIQALNQQVTQLRTNLAALQGASASLPASLASIGAGAQAASAGMTSVGSGATQAATAMQQVRTSAAAAGESVNTFGNLIGLASRRFLAFTAGAGSIIALTRGFREGIAEAIGFERELVRIQQVSNELPSQLRVISEEATRLATNTGVSSAELAKGATIFVQAGINAKETAALLRTLADAALAPNFEGIAQTAEGAIAAMRQFKLDAAGTREAIGAMNAVAGEFAVEGRDLIEVVRKTGGAFKQAGGDINELIALFTSVRATTRESAEEISTGLRTIFTRIQRPETVETLRELGVQLRYTREEAQAMGNTSLESQFVGAYEAVKRLSEGLSGLRTSDPRYAQIIEELGGYRQVSRVIPLIQQQATAQQAYNVALTGGQSLTRSTEKAQESLAIKLSKVKEEFLALFRAVNENAGFKAFADGALFLASTFGKVLENLQPIIPLLTAFAAIKIGQSIGGLFGGASQTFLTGRSSSLSTTPIRRATGGIVPGVGDTDSVPAFLTPGEFVINKRSAQRIGYQQLHQMNDGGPVRLAAGGPAPAPFVLNRKAVQGVVTDLSKSSGIDLTKLVNTVVLNETGLRPGVKSENQHYGSFNRKTGSVYLNKNTIDSEEKLRFYLAHELGHAFDAKLYKGTNKVSERYSSEREFSAASIAAETYIRKQSKLLEGASERDREYNNRPREAFANFFRDSLLGRTDVVSEQDIQRFDKVFLNTGRKYYPYPQKTYAVGGLVSVPRDLIPTLTAAAYGTAVGEDSRNLTAEARGYLKDTLGLDPKSRAAVRLPFAFQGLSSADARGSLLSLLSQGGPGALQGVVPGGALPTILAAYRSRRGLKLEVPREQQGALNVLLNATKVSPHSADGTDYQKSIQGYFADRAFAEAQARSGIDLTSFGRVVPHALVDRGSNLYGQLNSRNDVSRDFDGAYLRADRVVATSYRGAKPWNVKTSTDALLKPPQDLAQTILHEYVHAIDNLGGSRVSGQRASYLSLMAGPKSPLADFLSMASAETNQYAKRQGLNQDQRAYFLNPTELLAYGAEHAAFEDSIPADRRRFSPRLAELTRKQVLPYLAGQASTIASDWRAGGGALRYAVGGVVLPREERASLAELQESIKSYYGDKREDYPLRVGGTISQYLTRLAKTTLTPQARAAIPKGSEFIGHGIAAIAFRTPDGNVIRLQSEQGSLKLAQQVKPGVSPDVLSTERPSIDTVLQPLATARLGSGKKAVHYEKLPFAQDVENLSPPALFAVINNLKQRSLAQGYNFKDAHQGNIGLFQGRYVIRDGGAVVPLDPERAREYRGSALPALGPKDVLPSTAPYAGPVLASQSPVSGSGTPPTALPGTVIPPEGMLLLHALSQTPPTKLATGGSIGGDGGGDKVPALLTPGEFVLNRDAVARIGMARLHQMNVRGYAQGGPVQRYATGDRVEGDAQALFKPSPRTDIAAKIGVLATTIELLTTRFKLTAEQADRLTKAIQVAAKDSGLSAAGLGSSTAVFGKAQIGDQKQVVFKGFKGRDREETPLSSAAIKTQLGQELTADEQARVDAAVSSFAADPVATAQATKAARRRVEPTSQRRSSTKEAVRVQGYDISDANLQAQRQTNRPYSVENDPLVLARQQRGVKATPEQPATPSPLLGQFKELAAKASLDYAKPEDFALIPNPAGPVLASRGLDDPARLLRLAGIPGGYTGAITYQPGNRAIVRASRSDPNDYSTIHSLERVISARSASSPIEVENTYQNVREPHRGKGLAAGVFLRQLNAAANEKEPVRFSFDAKKGDGYFGYSYFPYKTGVDAPLNKVISSTDDSPLGKQTAALLAQPGSTVQGLLAQPFGLDALKQFGQEFKTGFSTSDSGVLAKAITQLGGTPAQLPVAAAPTPAPAQALPELPSRTSQYTRARPVPVPYATMRGREQIVAQRAREIDTGRGFNYFIEDAFPGPSGVSAPVKPHGFLGADAPRQLSFDQALQGASTRAGQLNLPQTLQVGGLPFVTALPRPNYVAPDSAPVLPPQVAVPSQRPVAPDVMRQSSGPLSLAQLPGVGQYTPFQGPVVRPTVPETAARLSQAEILAPTGEVIGATPFVVQPGGPRVPSQKALGWNGQPGTQTLDNALANDPIRKFFGPFQGPVRPPGVNATNPARQLPGPASVSPTAAVQPVDPFAIPFGDKPVSLENLGGTLSNLQFQYKLPAGEIAPLRKSVFAAASGLGIKDEQIPKTQGYFGFGDVEGQRRLLFRGFKDFQDLPGSEYLPLPEEAKKIQLAAAGAGSLKGAGPAAPAAQPVPSVANDPRVAKLLSTLLVEDTSQLGLGRLDKIVPPGLDDAAASAKFGIGISELQRIKSALPAGTIPDQSSRVYGPINAFPPGGTKGQYNLLKGTLDPTGNYVPLGAEAIAAQLQSIIPPRKPAVAAAQAAVKPDEELQSRPAELAARQKVDQAEVAATQAATPAAPLNQQQASLLTSNKAELDAAIARLTEKLKARNVDVGARAQKVLPRYASDFAKKGGKEGESFAKYVERRLEKNITTSRRELPKLNPEQQALVAENASGIVNTIQSLERYYPGVDLNSIGQDQALIAAAEYNPAAPPVRKKTGEQLSFIQDYRRRVIRAARNSRRSGKQAELESNIQNAPRSAEEAAFGALETATASKVASGAIVENNDPAVAVSNKDTKRDLSKYLNTPFFQNVVNPELRDRFINLLENAKDPDAVFKTFQQEATNIAKSPNGNAARNAVQRIASNIGVAGAGSNTGLSGKASTAELGEAVTRAITGGVDVSRPEDAQDSPVARVLSQAGVIVPPNGPPGSTVVAAAGGAEEPGRGKRGGKKQKLTPEELQKRRREQLIQQLAGLGVNVLGGADNPLSNSQLKSLAGIAGRVPDTYQQLFAAAKIPAQLSTTADLTSIPGLEKVGGDSHGVANYGKGDITAVSQVGAALDAAGYNRPQAKTYQGRSTLLHERGHNLDKVLGAAGGGLQGSVASGLVGVADASGAYRLSSGSSFAQAQKDFISYLQKTGGPGNKPIDAEGIAHYTKNPREAFAEAFSQYSFDARSKASLPPSVIAYFDNLLKLVEENKTRLLGIVQGSSTSTNPLVQPDKVVAPEKAKQRAVEEAKRQAVQQADPELYQQYSRAISGKIKDEGQRREILSRFNQRGRELIAPPGSSSIDAEGRAYQQSTIQEARKSGVSDLARERELLRRSDPKLAKQYDAAMSGDIKDYKEREAVVARYTQKLEQLRQKLLEIRRINREGGDLPGSKATAADQAASMLGTGRAVRGATPIDLVVSEAGRESPSERAVKERQESLRRLREKKNRVDPDELRTLNFDARNQLEGRNQQEILDRNQRERERRANRGRAALEGGRRAGEFRDDLNESYRRSAPLVRTDYGVSPSGMRMVMEGRDARFDATSQAATQAQEAATREQRRAAQRAIGAGGDPLAQRAELRRLGIGLADENESVDTLRNLRKRNQRTERDAASIANPDQPNRALTPGSGFTPEEFKNFYRQQLLSTKSVEDRQNILTTAQGSLNSGLITPIIYAQLLKLAQLGAGAVRGVRANDPSSNVIASGVRSAVGFSERYAGPVGSGVSTAQAIAEQRAAMRQARTGPNLATPQEQADFQAQMDAGLARRRRIGETAEQAKVERDALIRQQTLGAISFRRRSLRGFRTENEVNDLTGEVTRNSWNRAAYYDPLGRTAIPSIRGTSPEYLQEARLERDAQNLRLAQMSGFVQSRYLSPASAARQAAGADPGEALFIQAEIDAGRRPSSSINQTRGLQTNAQAISQQQALLARGQASVDADSLATSASRQAVNPAAAERRRLQRQIGGLSQDELKQFALQQFRSGQGSQELLDYLRTGATDGGSLLSGGALGQVIKAAQKAGFTPSDANKQALDASVRQASQQAQVSVGAGRSNAQQQREPDQILAQQSSRAVYLRQFDQETGQIVNRGIIGDKAADLTQQKLAGRGPVVSQTTREETERTQYARAEKQTQAELLSAQRRLLQAIFPNINAYELDRKAREDVAAALRGEVQVVRDAKGRLLGTQNVVAQATSQNISAPGAATGFFGKLGEGFSGIRGLFAGGGGVSGFINRFNQLGQTSLGQGVGTSLLLGAPFLSQQISTAAGTAQTAVAGGTEGSYQLAQGVSGGLQGALVGASIGGSIGGPVGAVIGGVVTGLASFTQSLYSAEKEIREVKIGAALTLFNDRLSNLANASFAADGTATNVSATVYSDASKQLATYLDQSQQKNVREATPNFFFRAIGYGFNSRAYGELQDKSIRQELGGQLPAINQVLTRQAEQIAKKSPNASSEDILGTIRGAGNGLNEELIRLIARIRGLPISTVEEELRKSIDGIRRGLRVEREAFAARRGQEGNVNAFGRLLLSVQAAADSLVGLAGQAQILSEAFDGVVYSTRVTSQSENLTQLGRGDQGALVPLRLIGQLGGPDAERLSAAGTAADEVSRVLPGILAEVATNNFKGPTAEQDFATAVSNKLRGTVGDTPQNNAVVSTVIAGINDAARTRGILGVNQDVQVDVTKFSEKLLAPFAEPLKEVGVRTAKLLEDNANRYIDGLTRFRAQVNSIGDLIDRQATIGAQAARGRAEVLAAQTGRRAEALSLVSLEQLQRPQQVQLERLTDFQGPAATDPAFIGRQLGRTRDRLRDAEERQRQVFQATGGQGPAFQAAAEELVRLKDRASNLQRALSLLSDAATRNAAIQEKLYKIQEDRQSRLSFGERFLSSEADGRGETLRGLALANVAANKGSLDGFLPQDQQLVLSTLRGLGNARLTGFKDSPIASDVVEKLLRNTMGGVFDVDGARKNEEKELQQKLLENFQRAEEAQKELIERQGDLSQDFLANLRQQQDEFFTRLEQLLARDKLADAQNRLGTAGREKARLDQLGERRKTLLNLGVTDDAQLAVARSAVEDIKKYADVRDQVRKTRLAGGEAAKEGSVQSIFSAVYGNMLDAPAKGGSWFGGRTGFDGTAQGAILEQLKNRGVGTEESAEVIKRLSANWFSIVGSTGGAGGQDAPTVGAARARIEAALSKYITEVTNEAARRIETVQGGEVEGRLKLKNINPGKLSGLLGGDNSGLQSLLDALNAFDGTTNKLDGLDQNIQSTTKSFEDLRDEVNKLKQAVGGNIVGAPAPRPQLFASGGSIFKPQGTDTVPAMLTPGEFVVRREAAQANLGLLRRINQAKGPVSYLADGGEVRYFAEGGAVTEDEAFKQARERVRQQYASANEEGKKKLRDDFEKSFSQGFSREDLRQRLQTDGDKLSPEWRGYYSGWKEIYDALNLKGDRRAVLDAEEARKAIFAAKSTEKEPAPEEARQRFEDRLKQARERYSKGISRDFLEALERRLPGQDARLVQGDIENARLAYRFMSPEQRAEFRALREAQASYILDRANKAGNISVISRTDRTPQNADEYLESIKGALSFQRPEERAQLPPEQQAILLDAKRFQYEDQLDLVERSPIEQQKAFWDQNARFVDRNFRELVRRTPQNYSLDERAFYDVLAERYGRWQETLPRLEAEERQRAEEARKQAEKAQREQQVAAERKAAQERFEQEEGLVNKELARQAALNPFGASGLIVSRRTAFERLQKVNARRQKELNPRERAAQAATVENVIAEQRRAGAIRNLLLRQSLVQQSPFAAFGVLRPGDQRGIAAEGLRQAQAFNAQADRRDSLQQRARFFRNPAARLPIGPVQPFGFAEGGVVPEYLAIGGPAGVGGDTVPAMLTPGEFVVNRQSAQANLALLEGINRGETKVRAYAQGGLVMDGASRSGGPVPAGTSLGLQPEVVQAFNQLGQRVEQLSGSLTAFDSAVGRLLGGFNQFNAAAGKLADALASFPGTLTVSGQQRVEVVFNGAEVLSRITPELKTMLEDAIKTKLNEVFKQYLPDVGLNLE